jgi:hypothetical protein
MSNEQPTPSSRKGPPEVVAPPDVKAEAVVERVEVVDGVVQSLGELRVEAMLRAVEESIKNQKERKNMPERTLTAGAALEQAMILPNIKPRLASEEDAAAKEISEIRDRIHLAELQNFDDNFDKWLNG